MEGFIKNLGEFFEKFLNSQFFNGILVAIFTAIISFFDSTSNYLLALIFGFAFNILAGFRADEVKIVLHRILPPIFMFQNFKGNKFKDSLMELFLIAVVTYLLKGLIDLMNYNEKSAYVVQWLFIVAIYVYFRNGLRNLAAVYPHIKFIRILYNLLSFKFRDFAGDKISDIVDKEEGLK